MLKLGDLFSTLISPPFLSHHCLSILFVLALTNTLCEGSSLTTLPALHLRKGPLSDSGYLY